MFKYNRMQRNTRNRITCRKQTQDSALDKILQFYKVDITLKFKTVKLAKMYSENSISSRWVPT